ncbi:ribonuclease H-like domain-containing protein, partial [Tanacetum coccineum]
MSMDDLYNNLKVYEAEIKSQSNSSSNSQNVAFVSSENTSSTNEAVNTPHEVSTASSQGQASSLTYAVDVMFSFFVNQSNSPQLDNEDLEQIDTDDLEEMDLKWQVAMLTMRVKRFLKKTKRNLNFNGKKTVGFDKRKVECYNCHRRGHFARECRASRNQGNRNGDAPRRIIPIKTPANALVVQDGIGGYDWSYQAEEGTTDFALMAHLSSGSSSSSSSNTEVRDNSITMIKNQLAKALREKDDLKLKLEKFETSSMKLTELINIPPPYTGNYMPSRPDLSFAGLDDSVYKTNVSETITSVPRNESTASKSSKDSLEQPKDVRPSAPIIEEWESDNENTRKFVIEQHTYSQAENLRKSQSPRIDKRNWNGIMTQKLRDCFEFNKKACFRVNHQNKFTHPHPKRNIVPTTVVTKSGQVLGNTAKQSSPRAETLISTARPVNTVAPKSKVNDALSKTYSYFKAHSPVNNVTTAGPEVVVSTAEGKRENVVKSSACWIWRPTGKGNPQYTLHDQGIFDSGCSRHMTRNKSFLTDYQEVDGGFVAFAGSPKGGKITGKGKIRTGKLDFEDVYFVKELKFNLFSVSQMCDKKNSIFSIKTECLVLSPDFKLLDESQVLLKVPRQNNMYSFDLKNVVPSGGLTCLFAKATIDESNLWHRRLGHINFKTMNKLVRGNLVR